MEGAGNRNHGSEIKAGGTGLEATDVERAVIEDVLVMCATQLPPSTFHHRLIPKHGFIYQSKMRIPSSQNH